MKIVITPEDIKYAENILLSEGEHFDDAERIPFILRFDTLDVQAIPGSGKTTALLAKLLILENKLPFENGSGILVLSHTNAAVEEIEKKIKKYCPKLFSYPNFIGTIQSFTDNFLAIPYYRDRFKSSPFAIDSVIYNKIFIRRFLIETSKIKFNNRLLYNKLWSLWYSKFSFSDIRFDHIDGKICLLRNLDGDKVEFKKPITKNYKDFNQHEKDEIYNWVSTLKQIILRKEKTLHFDDAYFLANAAIIKIPELIFELRKRFPLIFVDEMQDMGQHQISLLDKLFFEEENEEICFQRIGDKNQAIYGEADFDENNHWSSVQRPIINLTETHRLSPTIASIVEKFSVVHTPINSTRENNLQPILILYSPNKALSVLPLFSQIISKSFEDNSRILDENLPIKAIGWRKNNDTGITISSYFPNFIPLDTFKKQNGISLWADLKEAQYATKENSLNFLYKALWKSLQIILKLENHPDYVFIVSTTKMREILKTSDKKFYGIIEEFIYIVACHIFDKNFELGYSEFKEFVKNKFLPHFSHTVKYSKEYLETKVDIQKASASYQNNCFVDEVSGIKFDVCTVHSVKGETHTATLYLETYYDNDSRTGQISYESQRLLEQFKGNQFPMSERRKRRVQSAKMVYVGFSRAKHLLCFAADKDHFQQEDLTTMESLGWVINKELV